jgi:hypothetical protein
MVINEALASGTPVLSSPLPTHVRTDEAAMHANSVRDIVDCIADLAEEFRTDRKRYDARCALARQHGRNRDTELVYRRLRGLLFPDWTPDAGSSDPVPASERSTRSKPSTSAPGNDDGRASRGGTATR